MTPHPLPAKPAQQGALQVRTQSGAHNTRPDGNEAPGRASAPLMLPIRSLSNTSRERIAKHLLALNANDRYLRFGYSAGDEQIVRYVAQLNFERDDILGIYNRRLQLIATAHLAYTAASDQSRCAEFAVSVLPHWRGRGFGARLFERAAIHARNEGVHALFIHALSENMAMLRIARSAGAVVHREGPESEAFLELPPANFDSRLSEVAQTQFAEFDYQIKKQAKQFAAFVAVLQADRSDA